jgi:hypothetical protein
LLFVWKLYINHLIIVMQYDFHKFMK